MDLPDTGWLQGRVVVVVENPSDQRNLERIQLACQAFGAELRLVQEVAKPHDPRCQKSLDLLKVTECSNNSKYRVWTSTGDCAKELIGEGAQSFATTLCKNSVSIYDSCFDGKIALWFGQEKHGLSDEAIAAADQRLFIPMAGMVQSLNVAASAAVILAEVARQMVFRFPMRKWFDNLDIAQDSGGGYSTLVADSHLEGARIQKFLAIARKRQRGLVVVLQDPDRLDAGAILRACDAFGVAEVHFVFEATKAFDPLANRQVMKSEGSNLWVCSRIFQKAADCLQHLNQRGFTHVVLSPEPPAELSAEPVEMVFESQMGLESQLALWLGFDVPCAQKRLGLPGRLAASNFVAVILAELVRQRNSSSKSWGFTPQEQLAYVKWCTAVHAKRHPSLPQDQAVGNAMSPEYQRLGRLRLELAAQGW
eukprot:symbB.v1.2.033610.t1/scaffold4200.1/size43131/1